VQERAAKFGPNELEEKPGRSIWHILLDQFTNIMLLMLIAVAVVSALLGEEDAIAILVVSVSMVFWDTCRKSRAEQALAALKKLSAPIVQGIRQGSVAGQNWFLAISCCWRRWGTRMDGCWRR